VDLRIEDDVSGSLSHSEMTLHGDRLAELKIWGPAGAGDPAPSPPDPTRYTCSSHAETLRRCVLTSDVVIPWEQIAAAAAPPQQKPDSPPPTFATATATSLTDRQEVVNDSSQGVSREIRGEKPTNKSQDIWDEDMGGLDTAGPSRATTPGLESGMSTPNVTGPLRTRVPHGRPGEQIEMVSAPVNRR